MDSDQVCVFPDLPSQPAKAFVNGEMYCWDWESNHSYWLREDQYTCNEFDNNNCPCPELKADPDVVGKGVIVAFLISAALSVSATIILDILIVGDDNAVEPDSKRQERTCKRRRNRIDEATYRRFIRKIKTTLRNWGWDVDLLAARVSDLAQSLNDTQLVTGAAIVIAALVGLHRPHPEGPMTVYHFTIATDLAWLSSGSHLATLYSETHRHLHRSGHGVGTRVGVSLWVRIILMHSIAGFLAYGSWLAGYTCWYETLACPAKCTQGYGKGGEPKRWMMINLCLISIGYPVQLIQLLSAAGLLGASGIDSESFRQHPSRMGSDSKRSLLENLCMALRWAVVLLWDIIASNMMSIAQLIAWFVWGCYSLYQDRTLGHLEMSAEEAVAEDRLGFGQLVPLVLLLLPVLALIDSYPPGAMRRKRSSDFADSPKLAIIMENIPTLR